MPLCTTCSIDLPVGSKFCLGCGRPVNASGTTNGNISRIWPERFGPALVEGEVGKGGMAVVFRGRHEQLEIPVAIKAMSTSSPLGDIERFKREARVGMRLSNSGVVKVYGFGEVESFFYMIQEFVEGEDLRERIRRRRRFPWWEAVNITYEIADILAYIHGSGVVHRDIKPANIFLPWRGGVKIGDFGLATDGEESLEDERLTIAGLAIGSPAYMPPEQFRDTSSVEERGDLYALGITMFELLVGSPPFRSKKVSMLREMHQSEVRPRPSERVEGIPKGIDDIVAKLIAREPIDRFQCADDVLEAIDEQRKVLRIDELLEQNTSQRRTTKSLRTIVMSTGGMGLEEMDDEVEGLDTPSLPAGYRFLHPQSEGPGWSCALVHHMDSGQDLNMWLLDRAAAGPVVAEAIRSDLLKIGAANVRGFNGAIDVGMVEDQVFAAAFQTEGVSFADIVKAEGPLDEETAVAMILDLNNSLRPLHEAGIFLRGIRPERLYRDNATGKTQIDVVASIFCDEGLFASGLLHKPEEVAFLAPERFAAAAPQGSASADVFSIGAVLLYLMTGEYIHDAEDAAGFINATKNVRPASLRDRVGRRCTRAVNNAVKRALVPKPERRFPGLEGLSVALRGRKKPSPSGRYVRKAEVNLASYAGFDIGASTARMAIMNEDGRPSLDTDDGGATAIPTAIHLSAVERPRLGEDALLAARRRPSDLHRDFLRNIVEESRGEHPVVLASLIIRRLRYGHRGASERPRRGVLAVPTIMGERERHCFRLAGELAGLKVLGLIPDTTAAALSYALSPHAKPTRALVLDLGAFWLSAAVVELRQGHVQVLAADGLRTFGGEHWNDRLCQLIAKEYRLETGLDPIADAVSRLFLKEQVEQAKRVLTTSERARVLVSAGGKISRTTLERGQLEEASRDLLQRLASALETVLEKANLGWNSVDRVIAVGGAARMPSVSKTIWRVTGKVPDAAADPGRAVVEGACHYANALMHKLGERLPDVHARLARRIVIKNVTPFSIGVVLDTPRGRTLSHTVIPEQSPLPIKVTKIFALQPDVRRQVKIRLVEGDTRAETLRTLGVCIISAVPGSKEQPARVATTYALAADGQLSIEARDVATGKAYEVRIDRLLLPGGGDPKDVFRERLRALSRLKSSADEIKKP